jgi:hypothetical protein
MADTAYQKFFKGKLAAAGYKSPKDIPPDKKDDFFDMIDREYKGEKHDEKDEPGNSNEEITITNSRAGSLLKNHLEIEEDFYKTNKGRKHRNRKKNGLDNITPRD